MRLLILFAIAAAVLDAAPAQTEASKLWSELQAKREKLAGFHQEFEITQTFKTQRESQSSKRQVVLDVSQAQWREKSVSGSGSTVKLFDGKDLFSMEEGGDEYVRIKRSKKDDGPLPIPYGAGDPDWSKAKELEWRPCGLPKVEHQCVLLEAPLKPWTRAGAPNNSIRMLEGSERILLDMETGLLLSSRAVQAIDNQRGGYQSDVSYMLKRMSYGVPDDPSLFKLPSGATKEVKELSSWNAARIKKQLVGNPAPELALTDLQGKPVTLAAFKGKTVLLDFWTTWCPPCRADAPALDKLYGKYGGKDFMIVSISVSEDRAIVEKFLSEHPHNFPVALTTENEMPRPYQIGVFPTYIVIDGNGAVASAAEGEKGFADLRKLLKKAGLETD